MAQLAAAGGDFVRGELVLVVAGAAERLGGPGEDGGADGHRGELDRVLNLLLAELPLKQAASLAAKIVQVRDNEAYKRALRLKELGTGA